MSFDYVFAGPGWRTARALDTLAVEIQHRYPDLTCLGTIGDQAHVAEAAYSDHNPIVRDPKTGVGIVRAMDVGGNPAELKQLETLINALYNAGDPRLRQYGYTHMNGQITVWDNNPATVLHADPGDDGHLHISVTQASYPSTPGGYVSAIDSTTPWGVYVPPAPPVTTTKKKVPDVVIIRNSATGDETVIGLPKNAVHLGSPESVNALVAAGVPLANVTPADFASLVAANGGVQ